MADVVTISLLPVSLALVHIPRNRLQALSHPVLRHILHPSPTFFNVTANEIELSLFVDYSHVQDFEGIAGKDRRSMRKEAVELSYEPWSVLQIDSHTDQLDNAGARVNELSAPLAAAGISILYQSSYMSDFIFVKQSRLPEALALFEQAGFGLYTSHMPLSPPLSLSTSSPNVPTEQLVNFSSSPTVLTRSHSSSVIPSYHATPLASPPNFGSKTAKAQSPASGEVRILSPDLACVGLSDEFGVDHWGLKIVKLVSFPELIPSPVRSETTRKGMPPSDVFSPFDEEEEMFPLEVAPAVVPESKDEDDGYFSHSPKSISIANLSNTTSSLNPSRSPSQHKFRSSANSPLPLIKTDLPIGSQKGYPDNAPSTMTMKNPFFSFTRTQEGSSLTADIKTLAALFPSEERHLLICCGDLDLDLEIDEGCDESEDETTTGWDDGVSDYDNLDDMSIGELKCLQIDLRLFGLDKHGLVNKFSKVLEENGINHLYSSTFKTANLLVNKRHAVRAQSLLRGC